MFSIQNSVYHNLIKSEVVIHKSNYLQQTTIIYTKLAYLPHSHPVSTTYLINYLSQTDTYFLFKLFIYLWEMLFYLFSLFISNLFICYLIKKPPRFLREAFLPFVIISPN